MVVALESALDMTNRLTLQPDARSLRIGIAVSRYHSWSTDKLLEGAIARFGRLGGLEDDLLVVPVSGTWELTSVVRALCESGELDGVVALGVVIQGETPHFQFICDGVTAGLTQTTVESGVPIGFGVLTCNSAEEVEARSGGEVGNKGAEALQAVVESAQAIQAIQEWASDNETATKEE